MENFNEKMFELLRKFFGETMLLDPPSLIEDIEAVEVAIKSGNTSLLMGSLQYLTDLRYLRGDKTGFLREAYSEFSKYCKK